MGDCHVVVLKTMRLVLFGVRSVYTVVLVVKVKEILKFFSEWLLQSHFQDCIVSLKNKASFCCSSKRRIIGQTRKNMLPNV